MDRESIALSTAVLETLISLAYVIQPTADGGSISVSPSPLMDLLIFYLCLHTYVLAIFPVWFLPMLIHDYLISSSIYVHLWSTSLHMHIITFHQPYHGCPLMLYEFIYIYIYMLLMWAYLYKLLTRALPVQTWIPNLRSISLCTRCSSILHQFTKHCSSMFHQLAHTMLACPYTFVLIPPLRQ